MATTTTVTTDRNAPKRRAMTPAAWLGLIVSLAVIVVGVVVVWLGTMNDADGDPLIQDPGGVLIALIGLVGLMMSTLFPQILQLKRHVENGHKDASGKPKGLRDDLDEKDDKLNQKIDLILKNQERHDQRLTNVETSNTMLAQAVIRNASGLAELETTVETNRRRNDERYTDF